MLYWTTRACPLELQTVSGNKFELSRSETARILAKAYYSGLELVKRDDVSLRAAAFGHVVVTPPASCELHACPAAGSSRK